MKTVLITGSSGFVGSYLIRELMDLAYQILSPRSDELDITSARSVSRYFENKRPDLIFNLAAQSKPGLSFTAFDRTFDINLGGTHNLLETIRTLDNYKPRIFLVGSAEEHGVADHLPIVEDSPFHPVNPYGLSKLAAYYLSQQYVRNFGMDIVYVCPFTNLGPGQKVGFLVPDVCKQIVDIEKGSQSAVIKVGNLAAQKDFTDVRDVVKGYVSLIGKGSSGERYILCSGKAVQTQEIVDFLVSMSYVKINIEIDPAKFRPNEISVLYGSNKKTCELTGWKPTIDLKTTLRDCLNFARNTEAVV